LRAGRTRGGEEKDQHSKCCGAIAQSHDSSPD
jgi:hypothetical protein